MAIEIKQKITPFLWFDDKAEEAADFYVKLFPNSRITKITRYGEGGPAPAGAVMTVAFELDGQEFTGLNGGPTFQFTEAVSFVVNCESQEEIDRYWEDLSEGGKKSQCGWLKDRYGLSWQVVPARLGALLQSENADRVMAAVMQMDKLDVAVLERAAAGE